MTTQPRAYGAAHFALELDGNKRLGQFKSVEGGNVKTDFIKYQHGAAHGTFQRLGKPKIDDIKLTVGMSMAQPFYEWIEAFFRGQADRKTGAIVAADFYFRERARRHFSEAMITELAFPKLDGSDKSAAYMTVTISPEQITYEAGSNAPLEETDQARQKVWASCNFTFRIDGFEQACKRVTKIDAFTIKQKPIEYHHGGLRHTVKTPGRIEWPNLAFYVPEADAKPFVDYHKKRVLAGEVQADTRLKGQIECLDSAKNVVFTVEYFGADIFAVTHEKSDAGSEDIKQVKVELCVESMRFRWESAG